MSVSCLVSWRIECGLDDEARDSPVDVPEMLEDLVPAGAGLRFMILDARKRALAAGAIPPVVLVIPVAKC